VDGQIRDGATMKISISSTNPCHLYPMAVELAGRNALGAYYSGYPAWKLGDPDGVPLRIHSLRTNIVYGMLKFLPEGWRPESKRLFRWQDHGFDRWTGAHLEPCDFVHAMPGQCLRTFQAARRQGIKTVLNHATGPVREWVRIMEPEYRRVGMKLTDVCPYDAAYFEREVEEYALTDWHCVASSVVRDQLIGLGIDPQRIWLVTYGADARIFNPVGKEIPSPNTDPAGAATAPFRIVFAGQVGIRKGLRALLEALTLAQRPDWQMHFYGAVLGEARHDVDAYQGATPLTFHGPVGQETLAEAFCSGSVLVLPSLEEGFGLVVPQALNCGLPAIVSDRVGGKDFVRHRENGSVFPVGDAPALASELLWWAQHPYRVQESFGWREPAEKLIEFSAAALQ
jgi:glycosyltransferase involved in cell wall biosynthesis